MTEAYAYLTKLGVSYGYCVIPEFTIPIGEPYKRKLDLVFAKKILNPRIEIPQNNLDVWEVHYAFEIEGINVPLKRLDEHIENYAYFQSQQNGSFKKGISFLYNKAYHRGTWNRLYSDNYERLFANREKRFRQLAGNYYRNTMQIFMAEVIDENFLFEQSNPWFLWR